MNKIITLHLTGLLLAVYPSRLKAQTYSQSQPGYVVTTSGETLRGMLTVPQFVTDEGVSLIATGQTVVQKFGVQTVRAFGLQDGRRYVKRTIAAGFNKQTGVVDSATMLLQHQISGAANFYRYDFNTNRDQAMGQNTQADAVQYFADLSGRSLVPIRRLNHQAVLPVLFKDCQAVAASVYRTSFSEDKLGNLVLRYNTLCHADIPVHDYRLAQAPSTVQLLVSLRAGLQQSTLYYSTSNYLTKDNAQGSVRPSFALELRLAYKGACSLISGVHYAQMRSKSTRTQLAQLGTVNAGQTLALPTSVQVTSVQVPLLLRYTLGHARLRPYLAAGPMFGIYTGNKTTLSYTVLNNASPGGVRLRNDVVVEEAQGSDLTHPIVSGLVRLGLQFKTKTRVTPLLEVQYTGGSDYEKTPD